MRWLLLLLLVTVVWFLVHVAGAAGTLLDNHRRGQPPDAKVGFSLFPGMIVMPIASMGIAVIGDRFAMPWGFRVVATLHMICGVWLAGYIAWVILRIRGPRRRA